MINFTVLFSMLMKQIIITTLFIVVALSGLPAQGTYREQIYSAFINGEINRWVSVINTMEKEQLTGTDKKLELVSYYYGYIGYLLGKKKNAEAEKYIARGEKLIDQVVKSSPRNATAYAFKGSFIGFKVGLNKLSAISLGPESIENVNKALELEPQNTQALIDKANTLYHAPRLFGGDKKEAIKYIRKAISCFETGGNVKNNWLYINTIAQLGRMYENQGQYENAAQAYEKALRVEPDFRWVKNEIYPALKAKMKSK